MPGKIFVNYRRDDARDMAARIRDRLAATFGDANIFMDVDNLLAGQRFDKELEKALVATDVFLAVIGPRWLELLAERRGSGERDYVREEIAGALQRGIIVIPVLVERTPMPRADALPADIRHLVLHQKHVVTHEQFGRDVAGLVEAIRFSRRVVRAGAGKGAVGWLGTVVVVSLLSLVVGGAVLAFQWASIPWSTGRDAKDKAIETKEGKQRWPALQEAKRPQPKETAPQTVRVEAASTRPVEADLLRAGREFRDCPDVCPEMVVIPAGDFTMGLSPGEIAAVKKQVGSDWAKSEGPQRKVTITRPLAVGKFEVTFAQWDACVVAGGCSHQPDDEGWGRGRRPVIKVSWQDAKEYVDWLSRKTGKTYRLLSEAEWEYAARAGTTTRYAFGDFLNKSDAHFASIETKEVGSFPPNNFGLHDMHGNVWELCEDNWHENYEGAPLDGSVWSGGDTSLRVIRGGSWGDSSIVLRATARYWQQPNDRYYIVGFRVARAP
jgi:formylglycine-generating enzyme required for sulfatase activity